MTPTNVEYRVTSTSDISVNSERKLSGMAARYGVRAQLPDFQETIAQGAFKSILATKPDVVLLVDHSPSAVLGRTASGTLTLAETRDGLAFSCTLPNTQVARDLHENVRLGNIAGMSFGFLSAPSDQSWQQEGRTVVRTLKGFSMLRDISCCTFPAYPETSIAARFESVPVEVRAQAMRETGASAVEVEAAVNAWTQDQEFEWLVAATRRSAAVIF